MIDWDLEIEKANARVEVLEAVLKSAELYGRNMTFAVVEGRLDGERTFLKRIQGNDDKTLETY